MPLDHYVPQVHLKNFHSPALGKMLYAVRKTSMTTFRCRTKDVCRTEEGSTNKYLDEPRIIEEFLTTIEPRYNTNIQKLRDGRIDNEAVYVIAGFAAYVGTCSPTAMRLNAAPLRETIEATANLLDRRGDIPKAPKSLGEKTISELLSEGTVHIEIDGKYPQAVGIHNVMRLVGNLGNSDWEILINNRVGSPFFTSDYPVAIEETPNPLVINRIIPLAPDLAIRIKPDLHRENLDNLDFPGFRYALRTATLKEVRNINRAIVQSAEDLVFFCHDYDWVRRFVEKHRRYRVQCTNRKIPIEKGEVVWSRLELRESDPVATTSTPLPH